MQSLLKEFPKTQTQTHTSFDSVGNRTKTHSVPAEAQARFREELYDLLSNPRVVKQWCLTERTQDPTVFFADVDCNANDFKTSVDVVPFMQAIIEVYDMVIDKSFGKQKEADACVVAARLPYKLHLIYPSIIVTKKEAKSLVEAARKALSERFPERGTDFFSKTLDHSVYTSGLRILWCSKANMGNANKAEQREEKMVAHAQLYEKDQDNIHREYRDYYTVVERATFQPIPRSREHLNWCSIIASPDAKLTPNVKGSEINSESSGGKRGKASTKKNEKGKKRAKTQTQEDGGEQSEKLAWHAAIPASLVEFIKGRCNVYSSRLREMKYDGEHKTFVISTLEKSCPFLEDDHKSNNQYFVVSCKTGKMQRKCHDEECKKSHKYFEYVLDEIILGDLKACVPQANILDTELLEQAKTEVKEMINNEWSDNEQLVVEDDLTTSVVPGQSIRYNGQAGCPYCGSVLKVMYAQSDQENRAGFWIKCISCRFRDPKSSFQSVYHIPTNFATLNGVIAAQFNINITNNNYNNTSIETSSSIGWNEFLDDGLTIYEDSELNTILLKALAGKEAKVAALFKKLYGDRFVFARGEKEKCYHFDGNLWKTNMNAFREHIISSEFASYFYRARDVFGKSGVQNKDKKVKAIGDVISKLDTSGFQSQILDQCSIILCRQDREFLDLMDTRRDLLGFDNGVYDLRNSVFRKAGPLEYVTKSVGYSYDEHLMNDPVITQKTQQFLDLVFPHVEVQEYVLKFLGSCLAGFTDDQLFHFGFGDGANGKGVLINLMDYTLGSYASKMESTFICGRSPDPDSPTPSLTKLVGKRFVYISEVVEGSKMNEQLFKQLSGQDRLPYRPMHQESRDFIPDFKLFMVCNNLPNFDGSEYSMKRRIRVIPFVSSFRIEGIEEIDNTKYQYRRDKELVKNCKEWRWVFMKMLLHAYKRYVSDGLEEPEQIAQITKRYEDENDIFKTYLNERTESGEGDILCLEMNQDFTNWLKTSNQVYTGSITAKKLSEQFMKTKKLTKSKKKHAYYCNIQWKQTKSYA